MNTNSNVVTDAVVAVAVTAKRGRRVEPNSASGLVRQLYADMLRDNPSVKNKAVASKAVALYNINVASANVFVSKARNPNGKKIKTIADLVQAVTDNDVIDSPATGDVPSEVIGDALQQAAQALNDDALSVAA